MRIYYGVMAMVDVVLVLWLADTHRPWWAVALVAAAWVIAIAGMHRTRPGPRLVTARRRRSP